MRHSKDAQSFWEKEYREMGIFCQGIRLQQGWPRQFADGQGTYLELGIFYGYVKKAAYPFAPIPNHFIPY